MTASPTWRPRRRGRVVLAATVAVAFVVTAGPDGSAAATAGVGNDISWPQCGRPFPPRPAFGIVGVGNGRPFTDNPCMAAEYHWAVAAGPPGLYLNTANPGTASTVVNWYGQRSPDASCRPGNDRACAYDFGWNAARRGFAYANSLVSAGPGHTWWLDVETGNSWSRADLGANLADIWGSIDFLRSKHVVVGVYSTRYQWGVITGGASIPSAPNWVPGAGSVSQAAAFCSAGRSFSGGPVVVTQFVTANFDNDYACPGSDSVLHPPAPAQDPISALLSGLGLLLGH